MVRIHYGCGKNLLDDYVNVDAFIVGEGIDNWDISNSPFQPGEVLEILAEHVVEHIPFAKEENFFREAFRLLSPHGRLVVEVPDFEWVATKFIAAHDNFVDFYSVGSADHYFGNGRALDQRWSLLTTAIWGNQNGPGQFHHNGYTEGKLLRIKSLIGFTSVAIEKRFNKGTQVLRAQYTK